MKKVVAIVGATGLVGERATLLCDGKLGDRVCLELYAEKSAGKRIAVGHRVLTVKSVEELPKSKAEYAIFAASNEASARFVPMLTEHGIVCVDNSSEFRLKKGVPLVVPCVNGEEIGKNTLVCNPNCTTIAFCIFLNALKNFEPTTATVATYQAVSGAGRAGLEDLGQKRTYGRLQAFNHPIADNVIPQIGEFEPSGHTVEEMKMQRESRKVLGLPKLQVNCLCARIPVTVGHGFFANVKFGKKVDLDGVRSKLKNRENLLLLDSTSAEVYPMPMLVRNTKYVGVGRLHMCPDGSLNAFVCEDNLLRGAASNAVEILEIAMKNRGD